MSDIVQFTNKSRKGTMTEKQGRRLKDIYTKKKAISSLELIELKTKNKETLLKAKEVIKMQKLKEKILKRKGFIGLGAAIGTAIGAAQKELEK